MACFWRWRVNALDSVEENGCARTAVGCSSSWAECAPEHPLVGPHGSILATCPSDYSIACPSVTTTGMRNQSANLQKNFVQAVLNSEICVRSEICVHIQALQIVTHRTLHHVPHVVTCISPRISKRKDCPQACVEVVSLPAYHPSISIRTAIVSLLQLR